MVNNIKNEKILEAAIKLLAEQGAGVPTAKIAQEAAVSNGTLFNYYPTKQALLDLFNDIAAKDNEIDAILVSTYDGNRTRVAYSSTPKAHRKVDTDSYAVQLKDLVSLLAKTQQVNPDIGVFDHVTFQYSPQGDSKGGLINVTHLPHYGEYTFLIFISATGDGIEMLELYRNRNLSKIKELLDVLIGH